MSETLATPNGAPQETNPEQNSRIRNFFLGTTFVGYVIRGTLIPLIFYLLIFLIGFWRAWVDPSGSAAFFEYVRGLFETVVSIASIVIIIAIGVLIVQIARFVNLLRSEVKPITEDTKQAFRNVRATTAFVQENAVKPIIKAASFTSGLIAFLREISRISKILQKRSAETQASPEAIEE